MRGWSLSLIPDQELPARVFHVACASNLTGAQHAARHIRLIHLVKHHQEGCIGVTLQIIQEVGCRVLVVEFFQDDMVHCHPKSAILPGMNRNPPIGILGYLVEIRREDHQLGPGMARLGGKVHVRSAGHAHVGAHGCDELGIVPVGAFGHIGLLAPHFGRGGRQVAVPIIEAEN